MKLIKNLNFHSDLQKGKNSKAPKSTIGLTYKPKGADHNQRPVMIQALWQRMKCNRATFLQKTTNKMKKFQILTKVK